VDVLPRIILNLGFGHLRTRPSGLKSSLLHSTLETCKSWRRNLWHFEARLTGLFNIQTWDNKMCSEYTPLVKTFCAMTPRQIRTFLLRSHFKMFPHTSQRVTIDLAMVTNNSKSKLARILISFPCPRLPWKKIRHISVILSSSQLSCTTLLIQINGLVFLHPAQSKTLGGKNFAYPN